VGCKTTLKSSWNDFTAYYNTFYNARQNFEAGYKKVKDQTVEINPEQPIRIHRTPVNVGKENFEKSINRGAKILRDHDNSKWVDDALLLIGKSYFYRQEYFSADQKFSELFANTQKPAMKQRAVMWRGRVFLEMELYSEGISYLENQLEDIEKWKKPLKAEVQAVLAELYSQLEQWDEADNNLSEAVPDLETGEHNARAYFLYGQMLERLDSLGAAYHAYDQVSGFHPEYQLVYLSDRKRAEVSREEGHLDRAYRIFRSMSKDDKNFDTRSELRYEIGRTEYARGNYKSAEGIYNEVLHGEKEQPKRETIAKAYYGLAEISRYQQNDFRGAAAYYDSAASQSVDPDKLPVDFNAGELSQSFGEYARLKDKVHRLDSLMWLGGLSREKFDSVLAVVKKKKIQELKEQQKNLQQQQNTLVNVDQSQNNNNNNALQEAGKNGFLNYKNSDLVSQAKAQFRAIWGDRPLVDNWRRVVAIREVQKNQSDSAGAEQTVESHANGIVSDVELQKLNIDISEVPFTQDEKQKMHQDIVQTEYQLGNVFFLSLNMADSAKYYYHRILNKYPGNDLVPKAMYSLSELYYINGKQDTARVWARKLINQYPNSVYADRGASRFNIERSDQPTKPAVTDTAYMKYQSALDSLKWQQDLEKAKRFQAFGRKYSKTALAPYILFKSAQLYLETAKSLAPGDQKSYPVRRLMQLNKTLPIGYRKTYRFNFNTDTANQFPCDGAYWDSTRVVLNRLNEQFSNFKYLVVLQDKKSADEHTCKDLALKSDVDDPYLAYLDEDNKSLATASFVPDSVIRPYHKMMDSLNTWSMVQKAEKQRSFSKREKEASIAPYAMYRAAKDYMKLAMKGKNYQNKYDEWFDKQIQWQRKQDQFQALQDSAKTMMNDTTLSAAQKTHWKSIADSTLQEPQFVDFFPYEGTYWDSTRTVLNELLTTFPQYKKKDEVTELQNELKVPEKLKELEKERNKARAKRAAAAMTQPQDSTLTSQTVALADTASPEPVASQAPDSSRTSSVPVYSCEDLGVTPSIVGGVDGFLQNLHYPDNVDFSKIPDQYQFEVTIDPNGFPVNVNLLNRFTGNPVEMTYTRAIQEQMKFKPITRNKEAVKARCRITLPVKKPSPVNADTMDSTQSINVEDTTRVNNN